MPGPFPSGHSPLGASSMERAIACPGSVRLSYGLGDDEDDSYSAPGTAAHAIAAECATTGRDAWEFIGHEIGRSTGYLYPPGDKTLASLRASGAEVETIPVDKEMADAVQVYLDDFRATEPGADQGNTFIERSFHCTALHPYFYGTTDRARINTERRELRITDYKHGAGIVVEPEDNVQLKYYACGMLEDLGLWSLIDNVVLRIVQPRAWHFESSIREWRIDAVELRAWMYAELIPAMDNALVSRDTKSGQHCRFCPAAGHQCPQILKDTEELDAMIDKLDLTAEDQAKKLTVEQADRFYDLTQKLAVARKHVERSIFGMLQAGMPLKSAKLVPARSNREWKPDAEKAIVKALGKSKAFTKPELKTPAAIEVLPGGETLTARYAFKPNKGLTVAPATDARKGVNKDVKSAFKPVKPGRK